MGEHSMRALTALTAIVFIVTLTLAAEDAKRPAEAPKHAGPTTEGFLLPNGWRLTPVGKHVVTTDLPLNIIALKDSKHALIASSGFNNHDLALVNFASEPAIVSKATIKQSWFGLAVNRDQS